MAYQGRRRHRNMIYLTGLPGFTRFGYSPGWSVGGFGGLGPCAQYLAETGQLNNLRTYMAAKAHVTPALSATVHDPKQRLQLLKANYEVLKTQLERLSKDIEALESADKGEQ